MIYSLHNGVSIVKNRKERHRTYVSGVKVVRKKIPAHFAFGAAEVYATQ